MSEVLNTAIDCVIAAAEEALEHQVAIGVEDVRRPVWLWQIPVIDDPSDTRPTESILVMAPVNEENLQMPLTIDCSLEHKFDASTMIFEDALSVEMEVTRMSEEDPSLIAVGGIVKKGKEEFNLSEVGGSDRTKVAKILMDMSSFMLEKCSLTVERDHALVDRLDVDTLIGQLLDNSSGGGGNKTEGGNEQ